LDPFPDGAAQNLDRLHHREKAESGQLELLFFNGKQSNWTFGALFPILHARRSLNFTGSCKRAL
jgi:hypothetical protein